MKKKLQTTFQSREEMTEPDFELYYYEDRALPKVDLHTHDYYELCFFTEGDIEMQVGHERYPILAGDIMFLSPHHPHRSVIKSYDKPYCRFVFWMSREYFQHLLQSSPDYSYMMQYIQNDSCYILHTNQLQLHTVQAKLLRILEEMHADKFGRDTQISLCIHDLLLCLNRLIYEQHTPKEKVPEYVLYQQLAEYIEEHLDEELSLDVLAKKFFVSKYHIAHVFKNNYGLSIHQYITKKRLALCKDAIATHKSITETYQLFGFKDYSAFYRAFKKEYGISPKATKSFP